jgi:hypothetical protein
MLVLGVGELREGEDGDFFLAIPARTYSSESLEESVLTRNNPKSNQSLQ